MVGITLSSYQTPHMKTSRRWHYSDHSKVQSQVLCVEGVKCGVHFVNFLGSSLFPELEQDLWMFPRLEQGR